MASEKLTEYERRRLENIRRNDEMIAALKIHSQATLLAAAAKRKRVESKSYKVSPEKKPKNQTPVVIRQSLRTRGLPPDSEGLTNDFVESADNAPKSLSPLKPSLREKGPLSMKDAFSGDESNSNQKLIETILGFAKKTQVGVSVKEEFNSVKSEEYGDLSDSSEESEWSSSKNKYLDGSVREEKSQFGSSLDLCSLSLKPENVARVVPGRIMVVRLFPCTDLRMVMAGNKFGNIGFWNVDCQNDEENGMFLYRPHTGPISGILVQQSSMSKIISSCYNGFIRIMDAEKEVFDLIHSSDDAVYSLSQRSNDFTSFYFGEGYGGLNIWDLRAGKSQTKWVLHEDRINTIDFNSQNPNIMATSSTDGTAYIWDLRSMNARKPKPLKTVSHNRAVHSAYFSPSGSFLATTSFDNNVGVSSGVNYEDTSMIFHNNQTGRWISSFRAIWGWDDSYIFIGNMKRGVDAISPAQRRIVMTLQSPHVSAIPCRFDAHHLEVGTLAGATSGGQVYIWTSN